MPINSEPEALHSIQELPRRADEETSIPIEFAEDDPAAIERDRLPHRLLIAWAAVLDEE